MCDVYVCSDRSSLARRFFCPRNGLPVALQAEQPVHWGGVGGSIGSGDIVALISRGCIFLLLEAPGPSKPVENGPVDLANRPEDVH